MADDTLHHLKAFCQLQVKGPKRILARDVMHNPVVVDGVEAVLVCNVYAKKKGAGE